jgi:hypothetical protein
LLSVNWPFWLFQLDNGPFGLLLLFLHWPL